MDTSNYLFNKLLTRWNGPVFIQKEVYISTKQNLEYIQIFRSRMSTVIITKKRTKLDILKTWKNILSGYIENSKHLKVWVPRMHQVLITSEPVINKSKRNADLFLEHSLPLPENLSDHR